jgi:hypothetical protein
MPSNSDIAEIDDIIIFGTFFQFVCSAVIIWVGQYYNKIPHHNSALSGVAWVDELIQGHPDRIKIALGVHLPVFRALLKTLHKMGYGDTKHVTLREQLAIFLHTCVTGLTIRQVGERFQRANGTISKSVSYNVNLKFND